MAWFSEGARRALRRARGAAGSLACGVLAACSGPSLEVLDRPESARLERDGNDLLLDGAPYRFVGFCAFTLTGCGQPEEVPDDAELAAFFQSLRLRTLIRTYAFEGQDLDRVDRVVRAADAHGHLLAIVLADHRGSCNGGGQRDADWYRTGFRETYLPWVQRVVSRYGGEPAIGMWEPMKGIDGIDALTVRTFYDVVGGEIRQLDPDHLIEAGTHGPWAYGGAEGYRLIAESPGIDVATFHDYDGTTGVPPNLDATLQALEGLDKPVVLIETGVFAGPRADPTQVRGTSPCLSLDERRTVFESQLEATFATRVQGVAIWNWVPVAQPGCEFRIAPSDPLVGLVRDFVLP